jgi:hypothetical protein
MPTGMSGWHLLPLKGRFLPVRRQAAMCPLPPFPQPSLLPSFSLLGSLGLFNMAHKPSHTTSFSLHVLPVPSEEAGTPLCPLSQQLPGSSSSTLGCHFPHPCHWQLLLMDELTKELPTLFLHLLTCSLNSPHHKADTKVHIDSSTIKFNQGIILFELGPSSEGVDYSWFPFPPSIPSG